MVRIALSPACSAGRCPECSGSVHGGRVTVQCACPHHAPAPVRAAIDQMGATRVVRSTDPRRAGGTIVSAGAGRFAAVLDTTQGVLLENIEVCAVEGRDGYSSLAAFLEGRINHSDERAGVLYLFDVDGAAALVAETLGLVARAGPATELEFRTCLERRYADATGLWPDPPADERPSTPAPPDGWGK